MDFFGQRSGPTWFGLDLCTGRRAAGRRLPGPPQHAHLLPPSRPIDGLEVITVARLCLGRESSDARRLLEWARTPRHGRVSTAYHRRARSLARVATFLNVQRTGKATALAPPTDESAIDQTKESP